MGSKEITIDKKYYFPKQLFETKQEGKMLVINTQGCNWLVLEPDEYKIFSYLKEGHTVEETLAVFEEESVISVLAQIEAKQFEYTELANMEENSIFVYLTNRCNLRCKHCYMYAGEVDMDELSFETWIRVLKDFKEQGMERVTFSGGEATVRHDCMKILKAVKNLGYSVTLLSNGVAWTDEMIEEAAVCLDEVQFSLDGYDEESYEKVRDSRGFHKVLETAVKLYQRNTRVCISVTPLYDDLDDFVKHFTPFAKDFIKKYPGIYIKFNMELIEGRTVHVTENENIEYRQKMNDMVNAIYPDFYEETFVENYDGRKRVIGCGYGGVTIAANGDVYWCNRILELKGALSILDHSAEEILSISREIKKNYAVDSIKPCATCPIRYVCGGKCRLKYRKGQDDSLYIECTDEDKKKFYHKMIVANEYFFTE